MGNQPKQVTMGVAIKRLSMVIILMFIFIGFLIFMSGEPITFKVLKPFFIAFAIVFFLIMLPAVIIGYKYQSFFKEAKLISIIFIVLGILSILINGALIFFGMKGITYYIGLVVGIMFIFYGISRRKK